MLKKVIATLFIIAMVIQGSASAFSAEITIDEASSGVQTAVAAASGERKTGFEKVGTKPDEKIVKAEPQTKSESAAKKNEKKIKKKHAKEQKELKYKKGLAAYIRKVNKRVSKKKSLALAESFIKTGKKHNLDPKVLMALAVRESRFNADCRHGGYKGIMQTSDALAKHYGYRPNDLYKASVSIDVSARYLKYLKRRFGTYTKALCGYAYGSGAVASGRYNIEVGRKVMRRRDEIEDFLKKNNYV